MKRVGQSSAIWFIVCTALTLWLIDPDGPIRRNEAPHVKWTVPYEPEPHWIANATNLVESEERYRSKLERLVYVPAQTETLEQFLTKIGDAVDVEIRLDVELYSYNDASQKLHIRQMNASAAEVLEEVLAPLDLVWQIKETCILICQGSKATPAVRCYDLAWFMKDSQQTESLVELLNSLIMNDPVHDYPAYSFVGSGMIVSTSEVQHRKLERILAMIRKLNPANMNRLDIYRSTKGLPPAGNGGCIF